MKKTTDALAAFESFLLSFCSSARGLSIPYGAITLWDWDKVLPGSLHHEQGNCRVVKKLNKYEPLCHHPKGPLSWLKQVGAFLKWL